MLKCFSISSCVVLDCTYKIDIHKIFRWDETFRLRTYDKFNKNKISLQTSIQRVFQLNKITHSIIAITFYNSPYVRLRKTTKFAFPDPPPPFPPFLHLYGMNFWEGSRTQNPKALQCYVMRSFPAFLYLLAHAFLTTVIMHCTLPTTPTSLLLYLFTLLPTCFEPVGSFSGVSGSVTFPYKCLML